MRGVCSVVPVVVLLLGTGARTAGADDATSARQHFETGTRLFEVGEYRKALEEFRAAHVARPDPAFLYNSAQCHRLLGERREALTLYRRFLVLDPQSPKRPMAEKQIRELELAIAPPSPSTQPALAIEAQPTAPPDQSAPLYRQWWFWAVLGAAAAGVAAVVVTSSGGLGDPPCPSGVKCFR